MGAKNTPHLYGGSKPVEALDKAVGLGEIDLHLEDSAVDFLG